MLYYMQNKGRGTERQETEGKMKGNGFLGKKFRGHVPGEKITGFSARRICREPEKREQAEIEKER